LLDPMGMTSTNFFYDRHGEGCRSNLGYIEIKEKVEVDPLYEIDAIGPAGSINRRQR